MRRFMFVIFVLFFTPLAYGQVVVDGGIIVTDADHVQLPPLTEIGSGQVLSASMTKGQFEAIVSNSTASTVPVLDTNHANDTKLYAPVVLGGGWYSTRLRVVALEVARAITNLYLIAPDAWKGQNLKLVLNDGSWIDAAQIGAIMEFSGARSFELTEVPDKLVVAWGYAAVPTATFQKDGVEVRLDTAKVSAEISFAPDGNTTGQATVPFVRPSPCWILPVRVSTAPGKDRSETALAIANPNTVAASLTVELRDVMGRVKDSYHPDLLGPGAQRSQFINVGTDQFEGSVKMCSSVPFLATTFQWNTSLTNVASYSIGDATAVSQ